MPGTAIQSQIQFIQQPAPRSEFATAGPGLLGGPLPHLFRRQLRRRLAGVREAVSWPPGDRRAAGAAAPGRRRAGANAERVEDLVQEVYCRLLGGGRRPRSFRGESEAQLMTYLQRVAASVVVDARRVALAEKRCGGHRVAWADWRLAPAVGIGEASGPEDRLLAGEQAARFPRGLSPGSGPARHAHDGADRPSGAARRLEQSGDRRRPRRPDGHRRHRFGDLPSATQSRPPRHRSCRGAITGRSAEPSDCTTGCATSAQPVVRPPAVSRALSGRPCFSTQEAYVLHSLDFPAIPAHTTRRSDEGERDAAQTLLSLGLDSVIRRPSRLRGRSVRLRRGDSRGPEPERRRRRPADHRLGAGR